MYPSSADLAAFRASLMGPDDADNVDWPYADDHEREHGIGYRASRDLSYAVSSVPNPATLLRREASALRSRAYQAGLCPCCGAFSGPEGCDCYGSFYLDAPTVCCADC